MTKHVLSNRAELRLMVLVVTLGGALLLSACGQFGTREPLIEVPGGDVERGRQAIVAHGCISCHTIPGVRRADAQVGPPLTEWALRRYIAGTLPNEPEHLIAWIINPQEIEPGTAMPTLGVTPEEARDIAAYLYTLD